ncbi:MAG: endonuclease V [Planctomycetes bacterium]|nr:endonuclease V [Planctomycetota bacterium]
MKTTALHRWPRSAKAAIELQKRLAPQVQVRPVSRDVRIVAGMDVAFSPAGTQVVAGAVVFDLSMGQPVEQRVVRVPCRFPYVPGLLSFRELPGLLAVIRKLQCEPEVFLCDAQGLAHPRRMGLACHLGLWLQRPTVGCAKSRLCGEFTEPGGARGSAAPLWLDGAQVGVVLRTRENVKPLFVSPGHLCDRESARWLTLRATTRYRLPEPTRLAHQLVTRARTGPRCD